jgi:hypothetical protein
MKAINKIGLFLILLFVASASVAQDVQKLVSPEIVESFGYLNQQQVFQDDEIFLQQAGYNNRAIIVQLSQLNNGNSAFILQHGQLADVVLNQSGINNAAIFHQDGFNNSIEVAQRGNLISSEVLQSGYHNKVRQELGSNGMHYTVIQEGYKHEVIDLGFNPHNPGYTIKQTGMVGMTVTIQHH